MEVESPLLTVPEAARFLRVTPQTIRRMCRDGTLPAVQLGTGRTSRWRIDTGGGMPDVDTRLRGGRVTGRRSL